MSYSCVTGTAYVGSAISFQIPWAHEVSELRAVCFLLSDDDYEYAVVSSGSLTQTATGSDTTTNVGATYSYSCPYESDDSTLTWGLYIWRETTTTEDDVEYDGSTIPIEEIVAKFEEHSDKGEETTLEALRALRVPETDSNAFFPPKSVRADHIAGFDSDGNPTIGENCAEIVEVYEARDEAEAYASEAKTYASNASNYASLASTYATNASTSATSAATYATNASTSATAAATSASKAATSATSAATYASSASDYADTAKTYASNASDYADTAKTYASNASDYADKAKTYASNASDYADKAKSYATEAAGYADTASEYATASAASATESATYATSSATSATKSASYAEASKSYAEASAASATEAATSAEEAKETAESIADVKIAVEEVDSLATSAANSATSAQRSADSAAESAQQCAESASIVSSLQDYVAQASSLVAELSEVIGKISGATESAESAAASAESAAASAESAQSYYEKLLEIYESLQSYNYVVISREDYDALETKEEDVIYFVKGTFDIGETVYTLVNETIPELQESISGSSTSLSDLETNVETLTTSVEELSASVDAISESYTTVYSAVTAAIESFTTQVADFESAYVLMPTGNTVSLEDSFRFYNPDFASTPYFTLGSIFKSSDDATEITLYTNRWCSQYYYHKIAFTGAYGTDPIVYSFINNSSEQILRRCDFTDGMDVSSCYVGESSSYSSGGGDDRAYAYGMVTTLSEWLGIDETEDEVALLTVTAYRRAAGSHDDDSNAHALNIYRWDSDSSAWVRFAQSTNAVVPTDADAGSAMTSWTFSYEGEGIPANETILVTFSLDSDEDEQVSCEMGAQADTTKTGGLSAEPDWSTQEQTEGEFQPALDATYCYVSAYETVSSLKAKIATLTSSNAELASSNTALEERIAALEEAVAALTASSDSDDTTSEE